MLSQNQLSDCGTKPKCHKGLVSKTNRIARPIKVLPEVRMPSG